MKRRPFLVFALLAAAFALPAHAQDAIKKDAAVKAADLVLLDPNPLEDISHTRKINGVRARREVLSSGIDPKAGAARCRYVVRN